MAARRRLLDQGPGSKITPAQSIMMQILESAQVAIVGIASLYMMATNKSVRGYLDSLGSHNDSKKT